MARTRSAEYDNIHDTILERAASVFAQRGYAATSIGDIAEACECSKSRLYHYFTSKEAILSDMLTSHVESLLMKCRQTLYGYQDPEERFRQLTRLFLDVYSVSRDQHVALLTCSEFLVPETRKVLVAKQRELIAYVRDILLQLRPDLAKDSTMAHVDTMLFFGMINWTYTWYHADGAVTPSELADRTVDLFVNGYAHAAAPSNGTQPHAKQDARHPARQDGRADPRSGKD
ncbi:TetR/AcrR family transcriptional regulator [Xanthobacter autotrophicus]|uniref:TetR/AcrR family transcriptional regulator n=1 Tax=Xanthobacter autotrophicus TaxID=280 RepID=A0A6C1KEK9_XANAU|nr:TetR/AcrR family transcriptional regulator [Xanthobacter autotrophicus]TLX42201.1 TetR/AcrR family transcriptional regulator [Xanthobacter autotrophicus]